MTKEVDYLIVGQGLAGSLLAWFLHKENKSFIIIDKDKGQTATAKASGLINPITGRRFVKSWMIDELMPFAEKTYQEIEKETKSKILAKTKVHRILQSVEQLNDWASKLEDSRYEMYLKNKSVIHHNASLIENKLGCIEIAPVLQIDSLKLLEVLTSFLNKENDILKENFIYNNLEINEDFVQYKNIKAKRIIFSEGYNAINNPFFENIPFVLCKGEILLFEAKDLPQDFIIGGSTNIVPLGNHLFWLGSTYSWDDLSLEATQEKRQFLIDKLESIINCEYKIIDHKVGIRPTVKDRRPIIGTQKDFKNVFIFNGMGTKGFSLAPYFAHHFIQFLENRKNLNKEVSLARFV